VVAAEAAVVARTVTATVSLSLNEEEEGLPLGRVSELSTAVSGAIDAFGVSECTVRGDCLFRDVDVLHRNTRGLRSGAEGELWRRGVVL